ncbi:MAG: hypothetical protein OXU71_07995 [Gammaproteobacteria bacterium]|nr:hypothetical protein [Gammaproteobacteria bacterium]
MHGGGGDGDGGDGVATVTVTVVTVLRRRCGRRWWPRYDGGDGGDGGASGRWRQWRTVTAATELPAIVADMARRGGAFSPRSPGNETPLSPRFVEYRSTNCAVGRIYSPLPPPR